MAHNISEPVELDPLLSLCAAGIAVATVELTPAGLVRITGRQQPPPTLVALVEAALQADPELRQLRLPGQDEGRCYAVSLDRTSDARWAMVWQAPNAGGPHIGIDSACVLLDATGRMLRVSANYEALATRTGPSAWWPDNLPEDLRPAATAMLAAAIDGRAADRILPTIDTRLRWLHVQVRPAGEGTLLYAQLDELPEGDSSSLLAQVIRDPLTGAYNRRAFLELAALPAAATAGYHGALVLGIRRFRRINEVWGRELGDLCLVETANWLRALADPADLVMRLADGQFAILHTAGSPVVAALQDARERVVEACGQQIRLSLQAGWAGHEPGQSLQSTLSDAETAFQVAKRDAWRTLVSWTDEIAGDAAMAARSEEAVQQAFSAGAQSVHFQPIVDLAAGRVSGIEALMRLGGAAAGLSTDRILAASHRLGLTPELAGRVYDEAFAEGLRLRRRFPGCLLGINVSREFLSTGMAIDTVLASAERTGIALDSVVIELTEDTATGLSADLLFSELDRVVAHGTQLVIDDFGRGETSLALLRRLPLAAIKLDRSLLPVTDDPEGWDFVAGTVSLLSKLTGRIIAEGVETPAQSRRLRELGVHIQQGFLFGTPAPADDWLAHGLSTAG